MAKIESLRDREASERSREWNRKTRLWNRRVEKQKADGDIFARCEVQRMDREQQATMRSVIETLRTTVVCKGKELARLNGVEFGHLKWTNRYRDLAGDATRSAVRFLSEIGVVVFDGKRLTDNTVVRLVPFAGHLRRRERVA